MKHDEHRPSFFIVVRIDNLGNWNLAPRPHHHDNYDNAVKEAKRLGDGNPGNEFLVLESRGAAYRPQVVTRREHCTDREIPF